MITALIRTHPGREAFILRALMSCEKSGVSNIVHMGEKVNDYSYNLYCNTLKKQVTGGYFFFLDSDDYIIPGSINKIIPFLTPHRATIIPMLRNNRRKPQRAIIKKGYIGMPCMILHYSHKNIADIPATEDGDYLWIKEVTSKIPWQFINIPLVNAGKQRSYGQ